MSKERKPQVWRLRASPPQARPSTDVASGSEQTNVTRPQQFKTTLRQLPGRVFIKAGETLFAAGAGHVAAYKLPEGGEPVWSGEFEGRAATMLAGDDRLFVVTERVRGPLFRSQPCRRAGAARSQETPPRKADGQWSGMADRIGQEIGGEGYALAWASAAAA